MTIVAQLRSDTLAARKSALGKPSSSEESIRSNLLVTLTGEIQRVGKDKGDRETTAEEAVAMIRKFKGNTEATLALGVAAEAHEKLLTELAILSAYLPDQLSDADLRAAISEIATTEGRPLTVRDTGMVSKALNERFPGQVESKSISAILKEG